MLLGESQQQFASPGEALEHHGVKGMKWGVRKDEQTGSKGVAGIDPLTAAIGAAYTAVFLGAAYKTVRDIRRMKRDGGEHIQDIPPPRLCDGVECVGGSCRSGHRHILYAYMGMCQVRSKEKRRRQAPPTFPNPVPETLNSRGGFLSE